MTRRLASQRVYKKAAKPEPWWGELQRLNLCGVAAPAGALMRVEQFSSFLSLENHEMAEALRRLQDKDAAQLLSSGHLADGWVKWDDSQ